MVTNSYLKKEMKGGRWKTSQPIFQMNKSGKGRGNSVLMTVGVIAIIVIAIVLVVGVFGIGQTQLGIPSGDTGGCELAPIIDAKFVNGVNKGTAVTPTSLFAIQTVNGEDVYLGNITADGTTASTQFPKGAKVKLLASAGNYIDEEVGEITVGCGTNPIKGSLYATSTNTFRIFNTGNNQLSDNAVGGTVNQTASANTMNLQIFIDGTKDESTGDLLICVEATNTTQVDDLILSGLGGASKGSVPDFYSPVGAGSITRCYNVPALIDGGSVSGTLTIEPESGKTIGEGGANPAVYVTAYSKQAFVDTDGTFVVGVEDADGTTKYEDTWDYDFLIV